MNEFVVKQLVALRIVMGRIKARAEEGQGMVEYALILSFVAVLVVVAMQFLQPHINASLNSVTNSF